MDIILGVPKINLLDSGAETLALRGHLPKRSIFFLSFKVLNFTYIKVEMLFYHMVSKKTYLFVFVFEIHGSKVEMFDAFFLKITCLKERNRKSRFRNLLKRAVS